jgi:hypothetical protein
MSTHTSWHGSESIAERATAEVSYNDSMCVVCLPRVQGWRLSAAFVSLTLRHAWRGGAINTYRLVHALNTQLNGVTHIMLGLIAHARLIALCARRED